MDDDYDNYDEGYNNGNFLPNNDRDERGDTAAMQEILTGCVGLVTDAKMSLIHKIARRMDGHEHLWEPFARSLSLPEECIAQIHLMENGGGSPARLFLKTFLQQQPQTMVCEFMDTLISLDMVEILRVFDLIDGSVPLLNISREDQVYLEMQLDAPKNAPRWKRLAEREGIEIGEGDMDRHCAVPNLYHPTAYIFAQYRQRYPLVNFDAIRDFIVQEQCALFSIPRTV